MGRIWAWSYLPRAASIVHGRAFQRENFEGSVMNRLRFLAATAVGAGAVISSVAMPASPLAPPCHLVSMRGRWKWLVHGGGNDLLQEVFTSFNCYGIPMGNTGSQMGGWFRKEINKVEDLQGLKFRIGGFAGQIISRLGVVPQQLAPGDIYSALEKGTIDAVEWIGPADDEKLGFHKIAKYYYYPAWWEGGANAHTLVNVEKWHELPKSYQAVLLAAARDAGNW